MDKKQYKTIYQIIMLLIITILLSQIIFGNGLREKINSQNIDDCNNNPNQAACLELVREDPELIKEIMPNLYIEYLKEDFGVNIDSNNINNIIVEGNYLNIKDGAVVFINGKKITLNGANINYQKNSNIIIHNGFNINIDSIVGEIIATESGFLIGEQELMCNIKNDEEDIFDCQNIDIKYNENGLFINDNYFDAEGIIIDNNQYIILNENVYYKIELPDDIKADFILENNLLLIKLENDEIVLGKNFNEVKITKNNNFYQINYFFNNNYYEVLSFQKGESPKIMINPIINEEKLNGFNYYTLEGKIIYAGVNNNNEQLSNTIKLNYECNKNPKLFNCGVSIKTLNDLSPKQDIEITIKNTNTNKIKGITIFSKQTEKFPKGLFIDENGKGDLLKANGVSLELYTIINGNKASIQTIDLNFEKIITKEGFIEKLFPSIKDYLEKYDSNSIINLIKKNLEPEIKNTLENKAVFSIDEENKITTYISATTQDISAEIDEISTKPAIFSFDNDGKLNNIETDGIITGKSINEDLTKCFGDCNAFIQNNKVKAYQITGTSEIDYNGLVIGKLNPKEITRISFDKDDETYTSISTEDGEINIIVNPDDSLIINGLIIDKDILKSNQDLIELFEELNIEIGNLTINMKQEKIIIDEDKLIYETKENDENPIIDKKDKLIIDKKIIELIESSGRAYVVNPKSGATGLMQLMPIAKKDIEILFEDELRERLNLAKNEPLPKFEDLKNPDINRIYGEFYLEKVIPHYINEFKLPNELEIYLASYNAGPVAVNKIYKQHGKNWQEKLPKETRDYIQKYNTELKKQQIA
jgi:hypothetical protein